MKLQPYFTVYAYVDAEVSVTCSLAQSDTCSGHQVNGQIIA